MTNRIRLAILTLCLALVGGVFAESANAQAPYCGGWGYNLGYRMYGLEHIPYYALHPPVYYSYPVPRPYGYSPFAYPPGTPTPEVSVEVVKPARMRNPYVPGVRQEEATEDRTTAVEPLRMRNPFVVGDQLVAEAH